MRSSKICSKCGRSKSIKCFTKRRRNSDGLDEWCKKCKKLSIDPWRKKNKAKIYASGVQWRKNNRSKVLRNKRRWRENNPEKARASVRASTKKNYHKYKKNIWRRWLKDKYGITQEQFDAKLKEQNGLCAICLSTQKCGKRKMLYVDHCHATKVFRGLLCFKCNTLLGMAGDRVPVLKAAIAYLLILRLRRH